jgi:multidrug efflux pump subunit AcrB
VNLAAWALRNRVTTLVLSAVMLVGGIQAYGNLARLEDPEFTIKEAIIVTPYPGATAAEVEEEVSDRIEKAVQQLGQLDWVESTSYWGASQVKAHIKDQYDKTVLPQVWDELRRKVNDVQGRLPPGAGPSVVNDDFGDVWGTFLALHGSEYSYAELREVAKLLQRELLLVEDVAKIDFWGDRTEAVYVEPDRDRMSQLGIHPLTLLQALRQKNLAADSGRVDVGPDFIPIQPSGEIRKVSDFEDLLISEAGAPQQIYLRDLAAVRRGYLEPPKTLLRYDGHPAIGIGISTVAGGNVVEMGAAVEKRVTELLDRLPLGVELGIVSLQSDAVTTSIGGFLVNLVEAVVIVVGVLLLFMGLRSALIIGFILALTICGTFIFMGPWEVALERISLGALVIALGMLVDNAIVVVDGILVRLEKGMAADAAAVEVVGQTSLPLLGATAVAVMAFGAIGLSDDGTGEYCRSLFKVVLVSLMLSWVTAVTVTPVLGVAFLKAGPKQEGGASDPYAGGLYRAYRAALESCLRRRWLAVAVVVGFFALSLYGFRYVDTSFFPDSTRPQFMLDMWLPEGTRIEDTAAEAGRVEEYLLGLDGVTHVTSLVGAGGMRFLLTYDPEKNNPSYVQFLVDVEDYRQIEAMVPEIESHLEETHPGAMSYVRLFRLGPGNGGRLQPKFMGRDRSVLRHLTSQARDILLDDGGAKGVRMDWRERVKVVVPEIAEEEANIAGVTRPDITETVRRSFQGAEVGVYREGDDLLPIVVREPEPSRSDVSTIQNLQIWSPAADRYIPLRQVVSNFDTTFDDDIVYRMNRKRALTVHADPVEGTPATLLERVKPRIEAIPRPPGYELEWWGEYRDSTRAQAAIAASVPLFLAAMLLIVIALFNGLRQPAVIWLTVPLALIGVSAGLLLTRQPFGFMALLGFMSLSGMLIKNAIVLIDEIELQKREGSPPYRAIVDSGVSRLRPVAMAALTTALGMLPLLQDAFFVAMAVTIVFGLMVATALTMVIVPVLYAIFFRVGSGDEGVPLTE